MQPLSHISDWWIRDELLKRSSLAEAFSVVAPVAVFAEMMMMMVHCHHLVDFQLLHRHLYHYYLQKKIV